MILRCCVCVVILAAVVWPVAERAIGAARITVPTALPEPIPLYAADPNHLWNRLHAALLMRTGPDGKTYGQDRLEPLLWHHTKYLDGGPAAKRLEAVLKEFLETGGEKMITDPVKRAILQRDAWRVASWMARDASEPSLMLKPAAQVIRRLALSPRQIADLPDNYAAAVASGVFATRYDDPRFDSIRSRNERPPLGYLPADLFRDDGDWVCVGRTDGPTAPQHVAGDPMANSAFVVFVRLPAGRDAGLRFVRDLSAMKRPLLLPPPIDPATGKRPSDQVFNPDAPPLPKGSELALVRVALLIDDAGNIVPSRLVESVQVRVIGIDPAAAPKHLVFPMSPREVDLRQVAVFEAQMSRALLFVGKAGGLIDTSDRPDFKTGFATHGIDEFEPAEFGGRTADFPKPQQSFAGQYACLACHRSPTVYGTNSFQAFRSSDDESDRPIFPIKVMTPTEVAAATAKWLGEQSVWKTVKEGWR